LIALATWAQWVAPSLKPRGPDWFIDWKAIVPAGTQVLWLWDPVSTWMLLERPSYFSYAQAAGVVFSRDVAIVAAKRAASLRSLAPPELTLGANFSDENRESPLTLPRLAAICADPDLGFVVSDQKVGIDAPSKEWPTRGNFIHLYDCRAVRSGHQ
jgi:hypothetical protein